MKNPTGRIKRMRIGRRAAVRALPLFVVYALAAGAPGSAPVSPSIEEYRTDLLMIRSHPVFRVDGMEGFTRRPPNFLRFGPADETLGEADINGFRAAVRRDGTVSIARGGHAREFRLADIGILHGGGYGSLPKRGLDFSRPAAAGGRIQWSRVFWDAGLSVSTGINELALELSLPPIIKTVLDKYPLLNGRLTDAELAVCFEHRLAAAVADGALDEAGPGRLERSFEILGGLSLNPPGRYAGISMPGELVHAPAPHGGGASGANREIAGEWVPGNPAGKVLYKIPLDLLLQPEFRESASVLRFVNVLRDAGDWDEAVPGPNGLIRPAGSAALDGTTPLWIKPGLSGVPVGTAAVKASLLMFQTGGPALDPRRVGIQPLRAGAFYETGRSPIRVAASPAAGTAPSGEKNPEVNIAGTGRWAEFDITPLFEPDTLESVRENGFSIKLDAAEGGRRVFAVSTAPNVNHRPRIALWRAVPEGIEILGGGARLYKNPGGKRERALAVRMTPPMAGVPIHFFLEDPDDPATHPVIDPNGSGGNDNAGAPGKLSRHFALTDSNGEAFTVFTAESNVGGDNYRVVAKAGGFEIRSEIMTVWNRWNIEYGFMEDTPAGVRDYGPAGAENRSHRIPAAYLGGSEHGLNAVFEAANPNHCTYVTPVIHESGGPSPFIEFMHRPKNNIFEYSRINLGTPGWYHLVSAHSWALPPSGENLGGYATSFFAFVFWDKIQFDHPNVDFGTTDNLWIIAHELGHAFGLRHHEIHGGDDVAGRRGHDCLMTQAKPFPALNIEGQRTKRFGPLCVKHIRGRSGVPAGME